MALPARRGTATSGYESPTDGRPPPLQAPSQRNVSDMSTDSERTMLSGSMTRPTISRAATASPEALPPNLAGVVSKLKGLSSGKVSIKDRISCYQWTWFTMVSCHVSFSVRDSTCVQRTPHANNRSDHGMQLISYASYLLTSILGNRRSGKCNSQP